MKFSSRFMKFMGGQNLIFALILLILIGITIFIYDQVSFIFSPLITIFSTVAPPIILAFIAFYLLNPIVNILEQLRIKRIWGIIILILSLSGVVTALILLSAPAIEKQIRELIFSFPAYLEQMSDWIFSLMNSSFLAPYYQDGYEWVVTSLGDLPKTIGDSFGSTFTSLISVATTITHIVVAIVTFPVILFFLLKDSAKFKDYIINLFPPQTRVGINTILENMDVQVGSYIRGQIIVASCIGALLFVGYLIIGLDYAITLAIVAAVTSVVPYLGPVIAISPALIIAIVHSPFMLLKLAIVWAAVQFLEGNFVSPNVMGRTMQIHPLTVIIVLLVGGKLFGLIGVILGIPGYAILKVIVVYIFDNFKLRYNTYYGEEYGVYKIDHEDEEK